MNDIFVVHVRNIVLHVSRNQKDLYYNSSVILGVFYITYVYVHACTYMFRNVHNLSVSY